MTIPGAIPVSKKQETEATICTGSLKFENIKKVVWSDQPQFLLQHLDGRVSIWCKQHESMDPSHLVSTVLAASSGVMVWEIFSWPLFSCTTLY